EEAGILIGLALNAPNVLRANLPDQSRLPRELMQAAHALLLDDHTDSGPGSGRALHFKPAKPASGSATTGGAPPTGLRVALGGVPAQASGEWLAGSTGKPESAIRPLAERVRYHPRSLRLMAALMTEDNIPPAALSNFLDGVTGDPLTPLYAASFEALP